MRCPECNYDLKGSAGKTCPECGIEVTVVSLSQVKTPKVVWLGLVLVAAYCIGSTYLFWSDQSIFNMGVNSQSVIDPVELANRYQLDIRVTYLTRACLGLGIMFITAGLYKTLKKVSAQAISNDE